MLFVSDKGIREPGTVVFDGVKVRMTVEPGPFLRLHADSTDGEILDRAFVRATYRQAQLLNPCGELPLVAPLPRWSLTAGAAVEAFSAMRNPAASATALFLAGEGDSHLDQDIRTFARYDIVNIIMSNPFMPCRIFKTEQEAIGYALTFAPRVEGPEAMRYELRPYIDGDGLIRLHAERDFVLDAECIEALVDQMIALHEANPGKSFVRVYSTRNCRLITPGAMLGAWDTSKLKEIPPGPIAVVTDGGLISRSAFFLGKFFPNRNVRFFKTEEAAVEWARHVHRATQDYDHNGNLIATKTTVNRPNSTP